MVDGINTVKTQTDASEDQYALLAPFPIGLPSSTTKRYGVKRFFPITGWLLRRFVHLGLIHDPVCCDRDS